MGQWKPWLVKPCGTEAAYRRHLRRGEDCSRCREAASREAVARRRQRTAELKAERKRPFNGGREVVYCAIDGQQWDALDPGVRYVYGDGRWECVDEVACFDRLHGPQISLELDELTLRRIGHAFGQMPPARPGK